MTKIELPAATSDLIARYKDGAAADLARQKRMAIQYGTGAGLIALAAIVLDMAWLSVAVWAIFVIWLVLRLRAGALHAAAISQAFDALRQTSGSND